MSSANRDAFAEVGSNNKPVKLAIFNLISFAHVTLISSQKITVHAFNDLLKVYDPGPRHTSRSVHSSSLRLPDKNNPLSGIATSVEPKFEWQ